MSIATLLENPLDLSIAEVVQNGEMQFLVVTVLTPVRMFLAALFGVVALYFLWQMIREFAEFSWLVLWPGGVVVPVFGILSIVFFFAHQEKEFLFPQRKAIVRGGIFGLHAQREYAIPLNGRVSIVLRKTLNRMDGPPSQSQYQRHYDVTIEPLPAMGFTIAEERTKAQDFARKLAIWLGYEVVDRSDDPDRQ